MMQPKYRIKRRVLQRIDMPPEPILVLVHSAPGYVMHQVMCNLEVVFAIRVETLVAQHVGADVVVKLCVARRVVRVEDRGAGVRV
jgi:hypothetical protein